MQNNKQNKRRLPLLFRIIGYLLRSKLNFRGKGRIRAFVGKHIRGKGYKTIIPFDQGEQIELNLDDHIPYHIFLTGYYLVERVHTKFFRNLLREGMVVFDVGAHIGYYTLQAAVRVGISGQVYAFEPVSTTFAQLMKNIYLNDFRNVFANRYMIHDHSGIIDVFAGDGSNTGTSGLVKPKNYSGRIESVPCITIDQYIEQRRLGKIDLIKIDVEGSEMAVVKGMKRLLTTQNIDQLLIEMKEEHLLLQDSSCKELIKYLKSFGYFPYKIREMGIVEIKKTTQENLVLFCKSRE